MKVVIATRESPLALWQAEFVRARLAGLHPHAGIELLGLTTRGDQILDRPLAPIGGKGLFIKELEAALLDRRAHLAVHSLKDMPMDLAPEFGLAAILEREDPRDAFVPAAGSAAAGLEDLPAGARVGTSSRRREMLLRALHPRLQVHAVRGNVGTRLRKLDAGEFDALVMAAAGLKRLGLAQRIRAILPAAQFLPAPGQGALGIEIAAGDETTAALVAPLDHAATRAATAAERAVSRGLGGSCEVPLAAHAQIEGDTLRLSALVGNHQTGEHVQAQASGAPADAEAIAASVVAQLRARGALDLLAR
jgi:hydroxymethylbilane synthase